MKLFLLSGVAILLTGCAFSYTSSFSFELGNYKITNKEEIVETKLEQNQKQKADNVLSETRVGE